VEVITYLQTRYALYRQMDNISLQEIIFNL
jgi:hypothetical protein